MRNSCLPLFPLQLVAARYPDAPPHAPGVAGLHADAVRHVVQHLDLPRGRRGISHRVFHLVSSPGSDLTESSNGGSSFMCWRWGCFWPLFFK